MVVLMRRLQAFYDCEEGDLRELCPQLLRIESLLQRRSVAAESHVHSKSVEMICFTFVPYASSIRHYFTLRNRLEGNLVRSRFH